MSEQKQLILTIKPEVAAAVGEGVAKQLALSLALLHEIPAHEEEAKLFHLNQLVEILCGESLIAD